MLSQYENLNQEALTKVCIRHSRGLPSNFVIGGGYDNNSDSLDTFARASQDIMFFYLVSYSYRACSQYLNIVNKIL